MPTTVKSAASLKTKAELLEAYKDLMTQYDSLQESAKTLAKPEHQQLLFKTKEHSIETLLKAVSDLKLTLNTQLNSLADILSNQLKDFLDLERAIALAEDKLKLQYNIEVSAETLNQLVKEYEQKRHELETEHRLRQYELDQETNKKRQDWTREQEEYGYQKKLERQREEGEYKYMAEKRLKDLEAREVTIKSQEEKLNQLEQTVTTFPERLQQSLDQNNKDWQKRLEIEVERRLETTQKDCEAERVVASLQREHLEAIVAKQQAEIESLHRALDQANHQSQALASKVVEGLTSIKTVSPGVKMEGNKE